MPNDQVETQAGGEAAPAPPPKQPPLDFDKVEALRKHMLLTIAEFSKMLGVSRVTYNTWVKGGPVRRNNDKKVRDVLRLMLRVMTEQHWPSPGVIAMSGKQRAETLLAAMSEYE